MFVANRAMHRHVTITLYCLLCGLTSQTMAQIPTLSLTGGVASSNHTTVGTASFTLLYKLPLGDPHNDPHNDLHNDPHIDPHSVLFGFTAKQLYNVPTTIEQFTSTSTTYVDNDGASTITMLMATAGYQFSIPSTPLHIAVTGSVGGANTAHRRLEPWFGFYNIDPDELSEFYASTIYEASFAYALNTIVAVDLSSLFALTLDAGYTWLSPSSIIIDNSAYNAPSYRATFASPGPTLTLGLRYTPHTDPHTDPHADPHEDHLQLLAILGSTHPFTSTPYNEFNPGLAVHWRPHSAGTTLFAEGGAYQYSVGDRAMYLGGGVLFPLGTEWLKAGVFGGLLTTYDAQDVYFYPALSPRISFETPWVTATALLIPAGDATAIGFMLGFPLF